VPAGGGSSASATGVARSPTDVARWVALRRAQLRCMVLRR